MRVPDPPLHPGWELSPSPQSFTFAGSASVTLTIRGTEYCTLSVTLPGAQPFSLVCTQSFALSRALREALSKSNSRSGGSDHPEAGGVPGGVADDSGSSDPRGRGQKGTG